MIIQSQLESLRAFPFPLAKVKGDKKGLHAYIKKIGARRHKGVLQLTKFSTKIGATGFQLCAEIPN
jgi:hypothetical protein